MTQQELLNEFLSLPPEAQRQVMSFITFLRQNYALTEPNLPTQTQTQTPTYPLTKFYGCIQDETFLRHPQGQPL
ncbi:MAG: hypothetical protein WBB29_12605 [Geitlerinemataceae cyanobacterium]